MVYLLRSETSPPPWCARYESHSAKKAAISSSVKAWWTSGVSVLLGSSGATTSVSERARRKRTKDTTG